MSDFAWRRKGLREEMGQVINFVCLKGCHIKKEMDQLQRTELAWRGGDFRRADFSQQKRNANTRAIALYLSCPLTSHEEF